MKRIALAAWLSAALLDFPEDAKTSQATTTPSRWHPAAPKRRRHPQYERHGMEMRTVSVNGNQAHASGIPAKTGAPPGAGMQVAYNLENTAMARG